MLDPGLLAEVRQRLMSIDVVDDESISGALRESGRVLDRARLRQLTIAIRAELQGLGPLDALLADPRVTDVVVNGATSVWVDRGSGMERVPVTFPDEAAIRLLAVRLASRAGRRLDEAAPFVDARLPTGERLHAVIPPLAVRGTSISLRVPSRRAFSLADLVTAGSVDPRGADWLAALVSSRTALLITGGTGSGKTSILSALLGLVPAGERIVLVEDTAELAPNHDHVVSLEARPPNVEGQGEVTLRTLVRQALRMRPDRVIVGEVRGAEIVDMLAAMNTGHEGGAATLHANSPSAVPDRVAALGQAAGMSREAVLAQFAAGVEAILHVSRVQTGQRVISQVGVAVRLAGDAVEVIPALSRVGEGLVAGPGIKQLADRLGGVP